MDASLLGLLELLLVLGGVLAFGIWQFVSLRGERDDRTAGKGERREDGRSGR